MEPRRGKFPIKGLLGALLFLAVWAAVLTGARLLGESHARQDTSLLSWLEEKLTGIVPEDPAGTLEHWLYGVEEGENAEPPQDAIIVTAQEWGGEEEDPESDIRIEVESLPEFTTEGQRPTIVIYHTHSHEAYTLEEGQSYVPTGEQRTADPAYNIMAVGEALAQALEEKGFTVIHDTTDHEPPKLGTAYVRSLETIEAIAAAHTEPLLFLELHRDAYNTGIDPACVTVDGEELARILFVIGSGEGTEGNQFSVRPDYEKNYALAQSLLEQLGTVDPQLVRGISLKTGRYNQHIGDWNILVEMGHNANTLSQALHTVPYLADAIQQVTEMGME